MSEYLRRFDPRDPPPQFNVRFKCAFHNTVWDVLKSRGFREHNEEADGELGWDIFWCEKDWIHDSFDTVHLRPYQRVNHFRNHFELTRKDNLVKNMKRAKKAAEKDGNIEEAEMYACLPMTYNLPMEYLIFVEEFKKPANSAGWWIMKPVGRAQGKGIFLFDRLSAISQWKADTRWKPDNPQAEPYVVQKYVANPLLIGGKKFDLRLYVLVTSYSPMNVHLYRSGFARFSQHRYTNDAATMGNQMVHLTNVAIQKTSASYNPDGGKWDMCRLKQYLLSKEGPDRVNKLLKGISDLVIASLQAVQKAMINDKHCFELYGYDVLIDADMTPWLLEVNASPSLTATSNDDYAMKFGVLDDCITVLDLERYNLQDEQQVGGFDVLVRNGVRCPPPVDSVWASYVGAHNNRVAQVRKLAQRVAKRQKQAK
mmetsp:Transcript_133792/g.303471  ORF Transcript_133792/g.303471 Transcript_133792/m.303471 type:complete len:425 (+) Transcript_133792:46-1320(+)